MFILIDKKILAILRYFFFLNWPYGKGAPSNAFFASNWMEESICQGFSRHEVCIAKSLPSVNKHFSFYLKTAIILILAHPFT